MPMKDAETTEERVFNHDDDSFHTRTDWFLVGHGILFEAFFSARGLCDSSVETAIVWCFGLVAAWSWLGTSLWQLETLAHDKKRLRRASPVYDDIQKWRAHRSRKRSRMMRAIFPWQHGTKVFGCVLPLVCLLAWVALGITQTSSWFWLHRACLYVAVVAVIAFAVHRWWYTRRKATS
jgi:hypothetical protein